MQVSFYPDLPQSTLGNFYLKLGARMTINRGFHEELCVTIVRDSAGHLEVVIQAKLGR